MAQITWKPVGGSINWGSAANWDGGVLPTRVDTVAVGSSISIGTGVAASAYLLNVTGGTFQLSGGSLSTYHLALFTANATLASGTYSVYGFGASFNQTLTLGTSAALAIQSGTVTLNGGSKLSGAVTGGGQLQFGAGNNYLKSGFSSSVASMVVIGKLGLQTSFTNANAFRTLIGSTFDLFGNTFTTSGPTRFDGTVGNGVINQTGKMTLGNGAAFANGLILNVGGTLYQIGALVAGANDSGAKINVLAGARYQINGDLQIVDPSSIASFTVTGTLAKAFGAGTANIGVNFSSTGAVKVTSGTLLLSGVSNTVGGSVTGQGTLGLGGVGINVLAPTVKLLSAGLSVQAGVTRLTSALTYNGIFNQTGGTVDLDVPAATLTLTGSANLDGGTLSGYGGVLNVNGRAELANYVIGGPNTVNVNTGAYVDQTGLLTFGASSNPVISVASGATWRLQDNAQVSGAFGNFNLSGTLLSYENANSTVTWNITSVGNIVVQGGELTVAALGSRLGGTLSGSGLLNLTGAETDLAAGVVVTVGTLGIGGNVVVEGALSYAGTLSETAAGYLDLAGNTLTLNGTGLFDSGEVADYGNLVAKGQSVVGNLTVGAFATLTIGGSAEQTGNLTLNPGDGPGTLVVASGATYTLDDDVNIIGTAQNGQLTVAGILVAAATGASTISSAVSITGSLNVQDEVLTLSGGGALGGSLTGIGTLSLVNSSFTLAGATAIGLGDLRVAAATLTTLGTVATASQVDLVGGSTVNLSGAPLTLSGIANLTAGTLTGTGQLVTSGTLTAGPLTVSGNSTLAVNGAGTLLAASQILLGDGAYSGGTLTSPASLSIGAGATLNLLANDSILGNGTLSVAGTLAAGGNGINTLNTTIVDSGTILANLGTLNVMSAVSGNGTFGIAGGALLEFSGAATVTASNTVSFGAGGGDLWLAVAPSAFNATLANFVKGDMIEFSNLGSATLAGSGKVFTVSDASTTYTLVFSTAQTLSQLSLTNTGTHGSVTLVHL